MIPYEFTAELWRHPSPGGWHFVSLPKKLSREIREHLQFQEEGWGRMKAVAEIGEVSWETAIWFDTKQDTYMLPVKAEIRRICKLKVDDKIRLIIKL